MEVKYHFCIYMILKCIYVKYSLYYEGALDLGEAIRIMKEYYDETQNF